MVFISFSQGCLNFELDMSAFKKIVSNWYGIINTCESMRKVDLYLPFEHPLQEEPNYFR